MAAHSGAGMALRSLFHDCDPQTRDWALGTLRPDWTRQAARQRLGVEPVDVDAGHCPHVSQPEAVAAILTRA